MNTLHQSVISPRPISRPTTPISSPREDFETPITTRHRSDTMLTASSSSSFPYLQTPETLSMLGVIHRQFESPDAIPGSQMRRNSYGFGEMISLGYSSPAEYDEDVTKSERGTPVVATTSSLEVNGSDQVEERSLPAIPTSLVFESNSEDATSYLPVSTTTHPSMLTIFNPGDPLRISPPAELGFPFAPSRQDLSSDDLDPSPQAGHNPTKSSLKSMVRKKLERSKNSLREMRGRRDDKTNHELDGEFQGFASSSVVPPELGPTRPKTSRLRSLLSISMSRSQSSASIRSMTSTSSHTTSSSALHHITNPSDTPPPDIPVLRVSSDVSVIVRDFATIPASEEVGNSQTMVRAPRRSSNLSLQVSANALDEGLILPSRSKGKARARSPFSNTTRPKLFFSTSSGTLLDESPPSIMAASQRINRPRAISMPLVADRSNRSVISLPGLNTRVDLFGTLLPRELQVMILSKLVEISAEKTGSGKWEGEAGGRRELFRLSRVRSTIRASFPH